MHDVQWLRYVLEYLAAGMTADEIVADFPELTADHIRVGA
ncbi:MAG TPA: DUF433 domain-containing protein [Ilumatobacteraceae bacterium]|nr:DUF433 domain-containing protein [Ilumatobacteraceae bacterium]